MRALRFLFVALLLAFAAPQVVTAADNRFMIWGVGLDSCGTFIEHYNAHERGEQDYHYLLEVTWVQGYVTAENGEFAVGMFRTAGRQNLGSNDFDLLVGTDADGMIGWLVNHCRDSPLDSLSDAAAKFTSALIKRKTESLLKK